MGGRPGCRFGSEPRGYPRHSRDRGRLREPTGGRPHPEFPRELLPDQPLREVADDRVEVHEEILDAAVHQLVLGGVHDHASVEDSLAARIQNGIQVGHPFWVGGHLYGHRVSSQGARAMVKGCLARAPNVAPRLICTSSWGLTTCEIVARVAVSVITARRL